MVASSVNNHGINCKSIMRSFQFISSHSPETAIRAEGSLTWAGLRPHSRFSHSTLTTDREWHGTSTKLRSSDMGPIMSTYRICSSPPPPAASIAFPSSSSSWRSFGSCCPFSWARMYGVNLSYGRFDFFLKLSEVKMCNKNQAQVKAF